MGNKGHQRLLWVPLLRFDFCTALGTARPLSAILGIRAPVAAHTKIAGRIFYDLAGIGLGIFDCFSQSTRHFRLLSRIGPLSRQAGRRPPGEAPEGRFCAEDNRELSVDL